MMDRMRGWIGMAPASTTDQQASSYGVGGGDRGQRQNLLLERQRQQLMIDEARLEDVQANLGAAVKAGRSVEAKRLIQERNQLQHGIQLQKGKINNLVGTQSVLATADENLVQAELMKDGAKELEVIQKRTEEIDLDDVVDRYRDATQQTKQFSQRLADPFDDGMEAYESHETGMDVDTELEMLMQQAADEKTAELDSISSIPPMTSHPTKPQQSHQTSTRVRNVASSRSKVVGKDKEEEEYNL